MFYFSVFDPKLGTLLPVFMLSVAVLGVYLYVEIEDKQHIHL